MKKILEKILLFIIVSFILINTVAFLVLNSSLVQHAIINYININYLKPKNLNLTLDSLSFSFFSAALNLNEVSIKEINENTNKYNFSVNQISLGFNVPLSYLKRKPVIKRVLLRGIELNLNYDANGNLILPKLFGNNDSSNKEDLKTSIKNTISSMPSKIELLNTIISLGKRGDKNFKYININLLDFNKKKEKKLLILQFNSVLNGTELNFPYLRSSIKIKDLNFDANINENDQIKIQNLYIKSNVAEGKLNLTSILNNEIENSTYTGHIINLSILNEDFFKLLGMNSEGKVNLTGDFSSDKSLFSIPIYTGKVSWNNMSLSHISIYSGSANASLKNKIVTYNHALIQTSKTSTISSEGEFELFGNFNFKNKAKVTNQSLGDILKGFNVNHTPVDFKFDSNELIVNGKIVSPNLKKYFELTAIGKLNEKNLTIAGINSKGKKPFSNFEINLNLEANTQEIIFDKSFITMPSTKYEQNHLVSKINVPKGSINFRPAKTTNVLFFWNATNFDLSNLDFLLNAPSFGIANTNGTIFSKSPSPIVYFQGDMSSKNGEVFGIKYNQIQGNWGFDSNSFEAHHVELNCGYDKSKLATINVEKLKYNFDNSTTKISASINGNIKGAIDGTPYWLPEQLLDAKATIKNLDIQFEGNISKPSFWNVTLRSQLNNFQILNGNIKNFNLSLFCKAGECKNSYLALQSIEANKPAEDSSKENKLKNIIGFAKTTPATDPNQNGQILIQADDFSLTKSALRLKITDFPMEFFNSNESKTFKGILNSSFSLSGDWKNMGGQGFVTLNDFFLNEINFGNLNLSFLPLKNEKLSLEIKAFNDQLKSKIILPLKQNDISNINLTLENLNLASLLNPETTAKNNLFTDINGEFNFNGPFDFNSIQNPTLFLSKWTGEGQFSNTQLQFGRIILNLDNKNNFKFINNKISIPSIILTSDLLNISSSANIDINTRELSIPVKTKMNLANLYLAFPHLFGENSDGFSSSNITIDGKWNDLKSNGNLSLHANNIELKNYPPALTDVDGQINFKEKTIEIQKVSAHKGKGEVSIAGNINFEKAYPALNLTLSSTNADFKLAVPIFLFADFNLNSDISLTGDAPPYLISGNVNVLKFDMIRDLTCAQISAQALALPKKDQTIVKDSNFTLDINFKAINSINIQSQCLRGSFSTEPTIILSGTETSPNINGVIAAETATLEILKTNFDIKKGEVQFVDIQKLDPNIFLQMQAKVSTYNIFWKMNGRFSQAHLDLAADPPLLPNGDRIIEADIIYMMSTGQVPSQSSSTNLLSASTGVASFLGINNFFDSSLNQTISTVTAGLVDNVSITPASQNGQISWRANANRSISQRFNLGVSYEDGSAGTVRTAYANYIFNDTVSAISSYNYTNFTQQIPTQELFSGLRFHFGSQ